MEWLSLSKITHISSYKGLNVISIYLLLWFWVVYYMCLMRELAAYVSGISAVRKKDDQV